MRSPGGTNKGHKTEKMRDGCLCFCLKASRDEGGNYMIFLMDEFYP